MPSDPAEELVVNPIGSGVVGDATGLTSWLCLLCKRKDLCCWPEPGCGAPPKWRVRAVLRQGLSWDWWEHCRENWVSGHGIIPLPQHINPGSGDP